MVLWLLGALQIILALRVVLRLVRSAGGVRIEAAAAPRSERVSIIVPILNERVRIKACLDGLMGQSGAVAEILMVDGGSSDGTQSITKPGFTPTPTTVTPFSLAVESSLEARACEA